MIILLSPVSANNIEPCVSLAECGSVYHDKISRALEFAEENLEEKIVCEVNIKLKKDFSIEAIRIIKASGNEAFDIAIVAAINEAAVFPEFIGLSQSDREKISDVNFRISAPD
ncbi:TonB C-terminal domain-containing protein [Arenicella xantha]|nr:TonB C-terminal domain-containing protein [Arenicella xantha]